MSSELTKRLHMIAEAKALGISGIMHMSDELLAEFIANAKAGPKKPEPKPEPKPEKPKVKLDRTKKGWW